MLDRRLASLLAAAPACLVSIASTAHADVSVWFGGARTSAWSDFINWSDDIPGAGDVAVFSSFAANGNLVVDLASELGQTSVGRIEFEAGSQGFTLGRPDRPQFLALVGDVEQARIERAPGISTVQAIQAELRLQASPNNEFLISNHGPAAALVLHDIVNEAKAFPVATLRFDNALGSATFVIGAITQRQTTLLLGVVKSGPGTLELQGDNLYGGNTHIIGGQLRLASNDRSTGGILGNIAADAGTLFDTSAVPGFVFKPGQRFDCGVDPAGAGATGRIEAGDIDVSQGELTIVASAPLDDPSYVLVTYTGTLIGPFANVSGVPAGYEIDYAFGNAIALVATPTCEGDLDDDGDVDGADLGSLLGAWGEASGSAADLNGDGAVDATDLGILFSDWDGCGRLP